MQTITTTIKRQWFAEIVARRKRVEYREIKPYWSTRLDGISCPFLLKLGNGMTPNRPEAVVRIDRVRKNSRTGQFELFIGRVVKVSNWDRRNECPAV